MTENKTQERDAVLHNIVYHLLDSVRPVVVAVVIAIILALFWLAITPSAYNVSMVVAPTPHGSIISRSLRPIGAAEVMSPIDLVQRGGGDELSDFSRFLYLLTSEQVAQRLADDKDLMQAMVSSGEWRAWQKSDYASIAKYLRRHIVVKNVSTTTMRQLYFRHRDRETGIRLLQAVYKAADNVLREAALSRAATTIKYINEQAASVSSAQNYSALQMQLMEQQREHLMLSVGLPFAAEALGPPSATANPDWPNAVLVLIAAAFTGIITGLAFTGLRFMWQREEDIAR